MASVSPTIQKEKGKKKSEHCVSVCACAQVCVERMCAFMYSCVNGGEDSRAAIFTF